MLTLTLNTIRALALVTAGAAAAQASDTVLDVTVGDTTRSFTMEQLQALPVSSFETTTIWTEGPQSFEGVSLADLLAAVELPEGSDGTIAAAAINDYTVEIPVSDAVGDGPIVAYALNGAPMSRRTKGPLWVVYPFDSDQKYRTETIYSRSIWQLDRLTVK